MATTLTLWLGVWPRAYLLQVGDSRCYLLRDGTLTQISRDQTMAQELLDQGVLTRTDVLNTRWANVLASAIGGPQAAPVVTRLEQAWGDAGLLCSDGLTRHVSDERIRERMLSMTSAKQVCESLLQDALDAGGSDNITILIGRSVRKDPA
jgi:protein phosphatase